MALCQLFNQLVPKGKRIFRKRQSRSKRQTSGRRRLQVLDTNFTGTRRPSTTTDKYISQSFSFTVEAKRAKKPDSEDVNDVIFKLTLFVVFISGLFLWVHRKASHFAAFAKHRAGN